MDLSLIGLFVKIVDGRSLSAAARKLGVTRANVSQRLKVLREVGAQLLRRSTCNLELTQAGHTLYQCGQRMLEDLGNARASIGSLGKTLGGRIRISVPIGFGRMFTGSKLLEFTRAHPGIALTVTFNNRIEDLIAVEVDAAIRITSTPHRRTTTARIARRGVESTEKLPTMPRAARRRAFCRWLWSAHHGGPRHCDRARWHDAVSRKRRNRRVRSLDVGLGVT